ncbi:hypothetical protein ACQUSR_16940 [Streptomyces sp. P1-3]|uniref:hypothetical protein n=1 Tax=Streptomyces sp. P1-3 TaxID=3421658 RepID=UPI003D368163
MNRTRTRARTRTTMARRDRPAAMATALAGVAVLGLLTTACGESGKSDKNAAGAASADITRSASVARTSAAPYVVNHYGEENADKGVAVRSPKNLVLSEFTSIHGVHWKQWGAKKAVGTGKVTGTWCLDKCLDKPLKATVTLSDPKTVKGKKVFSSFRLKLSGKPGAYDSEDLKGKRPLATR